MGINTDKKPNWIQDDSSFLSCNPVIYFVLLNI